MDKKKWLWTLVAAALAILSVLAVFSQAGSLSIEDLKTTLAQSDKRWLTCAVLAMLGYIVFEGEALHSLLAKIGYRRKHRQTFLYGAGDVYFSAITPSASGGQPASAFFMMKNGIPASVTTAVLLMNLVMYTLGVLTVGVFCFLVSPEVFLQFNLLSRILIVFGSVALTALAAAFLLLLLKHEILESICSRLIRFLARIHLLRHPDKKLEKLEHLVEEYKDCVTQMRGHKSALISSFLWNLAQRVSQISVTMFMYRATGGNPVNTFRIWVTQSFVAIGSNTVPIPGGMGVADYLMLDGFRDLMSNEATVRLELLSRGLSFYCCVMISGIAVLIGYLVFHALEHRSVEKN